MSTSRMVLLECDGIAGMCGAQIAHDNARAARKEARELGWKIRADGDYCSDCRKKIESRRD